MADAQREAAQTHAQIAQSATAIKASAASQKSSAERTTELAADRTVLAAERTYAAWVRTGLAALASGIGARALLDTVVPGWLAITAALTLILFSALCFIAAVWRELTPRHLYPKPDAHRLPPAVLLVVNGVLVLVSLAAFAGVLTAR